MSTSTAPRSIAACASDGETRCNLARAASSSRSTPSEVSEGLRLFETFGELVHAVAAGGLGAALEIGRLVGWALELDGAQRCDLPEGSQLARRLRQRSGEPWAFLLRARDRALEGPVPVQQVGSCLRADPGSARKPVRRIAAQRDEVRDERR